MICTVIPTKGISECYLHWIFRTLDGAVREKIRPCLLDMGCGQADLTIPTAKKYDQVVSTGIDLSEPAITQAREYAKTEKSRIDVSSRIAKPFNGQVSNGTGRNFSEQVIFYMQDYSLIENLSS